MAMVETVRATLGAYAEGDVRAMLHDDHKKIRDLAKRLAEADRAPTRKALVRELKLLLVAHSRAEEASVYVPLMNLRNSPESRLAGNEGMVEHNLADIVLERLANTADVSSDMWKAHAKVLRESLEYHIKDEEADVFSDLGKHFSDANREQMGVDFAEKRDKLLNEKQKRRISSQKRTIWRAA